MLSFKVGNLFALCIFPMILGLLLVSAVYPSNRPFWTEKSSFIEGDDLFVVGVASKARTVEEGRQQAFEQGRIELMNFAQVTSLEAQGFVIETQMTFEEANPDGTMTVYRLLRVPVLKLLAIQARIQDQTAAQKRRGFEDERKALADERQREHTAQAIGPRQEEPTHIPKDKLQSQFEIELRKAWDLHSKTIEETRRKGEKVDNRPLSTPEKAGQTVNPGPSILGHKGITPVTAFNLAYNNYLGSRYKLAVADFQRFVKDFPGTGLIPNAHYWMGESYYNLKDYERAIQSFELILAEYPRDRYVPPALYKLGRVAIETGDQSRARNILKRLIEEFPSSDEYKLLKNQLAETR